MVLPEKMDPKTHLESQRVSVQRHVSFYILNRSPVCFVWAAPLLQTGAIIIIWKELSGIFAVSAKYPVKSVARGRKLFSILKIFGPTY